MTTHVLTAATITAQSGEGFAAIALLGAIVVGSAIALAKVLFGRDQ